MRTLTSSQTSFPSTWVFNRDLQSQQNANSLDVRNHLRIWDAQRHLLHTFVKVRKKIVDNYMMNVKIEENFYIVSNIFSIDVGVQQRLAVAAKRKFTRCEK